MMILVIIGLEFFVSASADAMIENVYVKTRFSKGGCLSSQIWGEGYNRSDLRALRRT